MGLTQTVAHFYTGQGILVHRRTGAARATDLNGATICGTTGSIVERNLEDFARTNNIRFRTISFETQPAVLEAFLADRCDAISNDMINLSANRLAAPDPGSLVLLPDLIQKEMHGILVRNGDAEWAALTRWTVFALIHAEEIRRTATDPSIRRFLGLVENVGTGFGVSPSFAYDVVRAIGNYGELYERTAGPGGLGLERGQNRIWTQGGLLMSWLWQ